MQYHGPPLIYHKLVGGLNPSENMKVGWNDSSQYIGKIKFMFQTTNQNIMVYP